MSHPHSISMQLVDHAITTTIKAIGIITIIIKSTTKTITTTTTIYSLLY